MPVLVDFSSLLDQLCAEIDSTLHVSTPALRPEARFLALRKDSAKEIEPHENLTEFIRFVHTIPGYEPSYFQKLIFGMAARVFSQKIMKGATPQQQLHKLQRHGLKPSKVFFAAAECGRRAGKTDAGTQICAGLLVSTPNIRVIYVSLHETTCKAACDSTYRWLCMAGYASRIKKTTLAIILYGPGENDYGSIKFFNAHNPEVNIF